MAKFDRKKFRKEAAQEAEEKALQDPYQDFQGTASELLFLKFSDFMSKYRNVIFISIAVSITVLIAVLSFFEYRSYTFKNATVMLEDMEKEIQTAKVPLSIEDKIKKYQTFLSENTSKSIRFRTSKTLSDLYVEKAEYIKAAETLEPIAKELDLPLELKAYYYFLTASYRELGKDIPKAIENYTIAATVLGNNRETPAFYSWIHFNLGRLQISKGDKTKGLESLKKVVNLETTSTEPSIQKTKKLATYLIIKTNKKD
jgi:tetratricopeptide (TPR) repeat protein